MTPEHLALMLEDRGGIRRFHSANPVHIILAYAREWNSANRHTLVGKPRGSSTIILLYFAFFSASMNAIRSWCKVRSRNVVSSPDRFPFVFSSRTVSIPMKCRAMGSSTVCFLEIGLGIIPNATAACVENIDTRTGNEGGGMSASVNFGKSVKIAIFRRQCVQLKKSPS